MHTYTIHVNMLPQSSVVSLMFMTEAGGSGVIVHLIILLSSPAG